MVEKMVTTDKDKQPAMLLGAVGLILMIFGALEFLVPGMPLRGSGIGTICIGLGALLLVVSYLRLVSKATK